ncbi:hypothetical protein PF005_g15554 [Phytophthora fragariae]|uniref:Uncharacterized protein n=2 Tax=Phytophthora TaxID=4783 RepID=A0A6A3RQV4_9STRA|nr:hypothetical protein PF003_g11757 [Phytophthora fragariae]KAE9030910.1 hypothetical protein PR002_g9761 [Phytophthora rubi]KAE8932758.1 hypothetical protein PF009_g17216 [Phytophthora fragariae]KAE8999744.1 hypothetical protein PF011_g14491 [Phytophthora fragariae]KAE9098560.1 hypothetical protein PF007_g16208 [Phytophthora fragariae]
MAISKQGYGAIAMITIGTLYNAVAMIMPMWTANSTVNSALTNQVTSTNFKAGLMSFCIDSELTNSSTALDHCFYFKFGSGYEGLSVIDEKVWAEYSQYPTCEGYGKAGDVSDAERLKYATVLATAAGMDAEQFGKFLDKSCGLVGMATMTFGGMSMSNGLMAIISIVGAISCRKGNKKWVGGGFFLAGVAAFTAMLTFVMWMVQASPLGEKDDTSLKTAFFLMVIAMLHYPLAMFMFWKHLNEQNAVKEMGDDQSTFILEASDSRGESRAYM